VIARKLQEVEKKSEELQEQLETMKKAENDLESALTHCHGKIDELVSKHFEAREKVSESLHLVECAMAEKDAAVLRETQTRGKNAVDQQGNKCQCSL
jgi:predicted nuclease with TOPRIM domain